jgi:hypothetical protein
MEHVECYRRQRTQKRIQPVRAVLDCTHGADGTPRVLEYYEVVLYRGRNLLAFVSDYDVAEWRGAIARSPGQYRSSLGPYRPNGARARGARPSHERLDGRADRGTHRPHRGHGEVQFIRDAHLLCVTPAHAASVDPVIALRSQ